eukprot:GHVP01068214.1.p1 GENE.GHVP01068214.1~~GHVP01068214.1.p1  ORF type:complete len:125 (+),score=18.99 GHVP01068214.1:33-407(+)
MTFEVGLFKLSEDTNAIFLQPSAGHSADDELPGRNISLSEISFHMNKDGSQNTTNTVVPATRGVNLESGQSLEDKTLAPSSSATDEPTVSEDHDIAKTKNLQPNPFGGTPEKPTIITRTPPKKE